MPDSVIDRIAYSIDEAALACGVKPHHVRAAIRAGLLPKHRIAVKSVVLKSDLEKWIAAQPARAQKKEV